MSARTILSWSTWPALVIASTVGTAAALEAGVDGAWIVAGVFLLLAAAIALLEAFMPHERAWQRPDGELGHDVAFTLLGSSLAGNLTNALVVAIWTHAAVWIAERSGGTLWPDTWPVAAQVVLTLIVAELGAYWAHRINHEVPFFWRFHAIHHNVPRLWWLNSGRNHPFDTALIFFLSFPLLVVLGAPGDMMVWLAVATTVIGMLSHCNADMRCGILDFVFNTPGVHRWHHSRVPEEGNRNYGENLMLWDILFGTHYRSRRRPPVDIGTDTPVPKGIWDQLVVPVLGRPLRLQRAARALVAVGLIAGAGAGVARADGDGPDDPTRCVEALHAGLIEAMQRSDELDFEARYALLEPVVVSTYDLPRMARASLGRGWKALAEPDRDGWRTLIESHVVATYASRFVGYTGERFETLGVRRTGKRTVLVETNLLSPGEKPISFVYRVGRTERGWRILDVYFDGEVSELALRRAQYSALLEREGYPRLRDKLVEKVAALRESPE